MHPEIAYKLIRYQRTHEPLVPAPLAKKLLSLKAIVDEIGGHRQMGMFWDEEPSETAKILIFVQDY